MWNMNACNFENGQAQVNLNTEIFSDTTPAEQYTVTFNISLQVHGLANHCHLLLEVDNVTVSVNPGELRIKYLQHRLVH